MVALTSLQAKTRYASQRPWPPYKSSRPPSINQRHNTAPPRKTSLKILILLLLGCSLQNLCRWLILVGLGIRFCDTSACPGRNPCPSLSSHAPVRCPLPPLPPHCHFRMTTLIVKLQGHYHNELWVCRKSYLAPIPMLPALQPCVPRRHVVCQ